MVKDKILNEEKWLFFKKVGYVYIIKDVHKATEMRQVLDLPNDGIKKIDGAKLVQMTLLALFEILFDYDENKFYQHSTAGTVGRTRANKFLNGCLKILYGCGLSADTWFRTLETVFLLRPC